MRSVFLPALLALFLLLAGCTSEPTRYGDADVIPTVLDATKPVQVSGCDCMVCNYNDDLPWYVDVWNFITRHPPETHLVAGDCKFIACYSDDFLEQKAASDPTWTLPGGAKNIKDLAKQPPAQSQDFIKFFMLGQGPTFSDFDYANSYCNNSMGFAVRWYTPDKDTDIDEFAPTKERPLCYLRNDIMPVYIYKPDRSASTGITPTRRTELLTTLAKNIGIESGISGGGTDGIGPVIIGLEPEFVESDSTGGLIPDAEDIAAEIDIVRANCPKCLIAVIPDQTVTPDGQEFDPLTGAPKIPAEYYPPNSALRKLATTYSAQFAEVNLIGLHFFLNEYSPIDCRKDEALYRLMNYSKKTLALYGKPSILLYYGAADYITVDPVSGATQGCTPDQVAEANDYLITNIPSLSTAGIIGAAQYQFEDGGTNPAFRGVSATTSDCAAGQEYCNNLGLLDGTGNQKSPAFAIWFNRCQFYYNSTPDPTAVPINYPTGSVSYILKGFYSQPALTFPANGENTSLCSFQTLIDLFKLPIASSEQTTYTGSMTAEQGPVSGCDDCIGGAPDPLFYSGQTPPYLDPYECSTYELEAKRESEKCNLDPLMTKAVIWQESSFNPGAVSQKTGGCVPAPVSGPNGNGCWTSTKNAEPSPETRTKASGESYRPDSLSFPESDQCACGLMQTINSHYTVPAYSLPACPNFNPFVPSSSICGGTYKLCDFEGNNAIPFVDSHLSDYGLTTSDKDTRSTEYKWSVMWTTLLMYNAGPGNFQDYYDNWKFSGEVSDPYNGGALILEGPRGCELCNNMIDGCYNANGFLISYGEPFFPDDPCCYNNPGGFGPSDVTFINYVNKCVDPYKPPYTYGITWFGNPYAAQVIAKYKTVLDTCPSNCVGGATPPTSSSGTPKPGNIDCSASASVCSSIVVPPVLGGASCSDNTADNGGAFCAWRPNPNPHWHNGVDITPATTPGATDTIQAVQAGTVTFAGWRGGYGNRIEITNSIDGCVSTYSHLATGSLLVKAGDPVIAGTPIATMDNTGYSFGKHLHFSVLAPLDPTDLTSLTYVNPDNPTICTEHH